MAWGGLIFRVPQGTRAAELTSDSQLQPLGSEEQIRSKLAELFPDQRHRIGQSCIEGDDFWLELNYARPTDGELHTCIGVRSNAGGGALMVLKRICEAFGARLFDNQMGEFTDLQTETRESMKIFREFRDRNLPRGASSAGSE